MAQEGPVRVGRRLSAVLAADTVGYSCLMHKDEEATHVKLTSIVANVVNPAISKHGGRIVKNTGDGFLAAFLSAVGAVRAATEFQSRTHELTIDGLSFSTTDWPALGHIWIHVAVRSSTRSGMVRSVWLASIILVLSQYKSIGYSLGKHPYTRTTATGSDDDSRDSGHDRFLCIAV